MTTAQDRKDDAAQAKKDAASIGTLTVGDAVTVSGKQGTVVEALKSADGQVRHYRVESKIDKSDKTEIQTVAASGVELFVAPEDKGSETATFKAGDHVIARGGEKGNVTEVVTTDTDARLSMYRVQFGGTLGLVVIRGAELQVDTSRKADKK